MTDATKLHLSFVDLETEIAAMPKLAEKFLSSDGRFHLEQASRTLAAAKSKPNYEFTWAIPRENPIRTVPSHGSYERKRDKPDQKGPTVVGTLSFSWGMRTGDKRSNALHLSGNATTRLGIYDVEDNELGMWRMEVGAHDAPGCCFHTQIFGRDDDLLFPAWLPVPRLPSFPPSPMSCLEFLLSELFQLSWERHVERESQSLKIWRSLQSKRLSSFLHWQLATIEQSTRSPLVNLKTFPHPEVLMGPRR
jgi:hypothetical protein